MLKAKPTTTGGRANWLPYAIVGLPIAVLVVVTMPDLWRIYVALIGWFVGGSFAGFGAFALVEFWDHREGSRREMAGYRIEEARLQAEEATATAKTAEALHAAVKGLQELVRDYDPYEDPRDLFSEEVLEVLAQRIEPEE